jgi:hypothetical protein
MMAGSLPSPPGSAVSDSTSLDSVVGYDHQLPQPRRHPLRPGSQKEISLINYLDNQMLSIQRRYGKKFSASDDSNDDAPGYNTIKEVVEDINPLIDVAWVTGTREYHTFLFVLSR